VVYSEGAPPAAANWKQQEIAALPPGTVSFYDGGANQKPHGDVYYGLINLDAQGKLSACIAYDATTATTATCN